MERDRPQKILPCPRDRLGKIFPGEQPAPNGESLRRGFASFNYRAGQASSISGLPQDFWTPGFELHWRQRFHAITRLEDFFNFQTHSAK